MQNQYLKLVFLQQKNFYATGVAGQIPGASEGVARLLMEYGYQFDFIDSTSDFGKYRLLILPDVIPVDEILGRKLSAYINAGGKLLASYQSGLDKDHQKFMISELAVKYLGDAPYSPDFIWPKEHLAKGLADAEHVMYDKGTLVEATDEAQFVQKVIPPVFNRTYEHFCSHLHSPSGRKRSISWYCGNRKYSVFYSSDFYNISELGTCMV